MPRLRISVPAGRLGQMLPVFRSFAASSSDLLFETLVRDHDDGLIPSAVRDAIGAGWLPPDAVLTDMQGLARGAARGAWRRLPASLRAAGEASAGRLDGTMRVLAGEEALLLSADPGGPFLLHRPSTLADPPRSAAALLDYARQNPGRFVYPRPSESALGQLFLMLLPHLLGDRDPTNAQDGWNRSWAWLAEMDRYVGFYPSDDEAAFDEFAISGPDLFPASFASYLRSRMDGLVPAEARLASFGRTIPQGVFLVMPGHAGDERVGLLAPFVEFLLSPAIQSRLFGRGLLPGAAGFGLDQATPVTETEHELWTGTLRAEVAALAATPLAPPLGPYQLAFMLNRWDESIGARHGERP